MPGNYGIPCPAPDESGIPDLIESNGNALGEFVFALTQILDAHVVTGEKCCNKVVAALKRPCGKCCKANDESISQVVTTLAQHLHEMIAVISSQLGAAQSVGQSVSQDLSQDETDVTFADEADAAPVEMPAAPANGLGAGGDLPDEPAPAPVVKPVDKLPLSPFDAIAKELIPGYQTPDEMMNTPLPGPSPEAPPCVTIPPQLARALSAPGSPEWCEFADGLAVLLGRIGNDLWPWIDRQITKGTDSGGPKSLMPPDDDKSWQAIIKRGILGVVVWATDTARIGYDGLKVALKCVWDIYQQFTSRCSPGTLAGLSIVQAVLRSLHNLNAGIDPIVFAVARIDITLGKLETMVDYLINYVCPIEAPAAHEATEAWLRNVITVDQRNCVWRVHGLDPAVYEQYAQARGERLGMREAVQFARRNDETQLGQLEALRKIGFVDHEIAQAALTLYDELPTISDHLHWLQRNVFDTDYVEHYGLMQGFAEKFWPTFGHDLNALGMKEEYARLHYAAHWVQPSPEQMKEFVYRLRPGVTDVDTEFTLEDYERILVEQDYAPVARKWFVETAYKVPAMSYLRDMYRAHILSDEQMLGYHQDLGYTVDDSHRFVDIDRQMRSRIRATQMHGWNPAAIAKAYSVDQLSDEQLEQRMLALSATPQEIVDIRERSKADLQYTVVSRARSRLLSTTVTQVRDSLRIGLMSEDQATAALSAIGWPERAAKGIAALESTAARVSRVKHAISHLRSAYLRGEVDEGFAREQLALLAIQPEAIDDYLAAWALERTPNRRRRTASQISKDVAEGLLTTDEGRARLLNLGYEDADTLLYLEDAARQTITTAAAMSAAETLAGRHQTAALAKVAGNAVGLSKRVVGTLQRQEPPTKLLNWMCLGIITPAYVTQRLRLYGWDDLSIEKQIRASKLKKEQCQPEFDVSSILTTDVPVHGEYERVQVNQEIGQDGDRHQPGAPRNGGAPGGGADEMP